VVKIVFDDEKEGDSMINHLQRQPVLEVREIAGGRLKAEG
jgi:hypothetical protein